MDYSTFSIILYVFSVILMFGGILIFFAPKLLIKIGEPLNKEYGTKQKGKTLIPTDESIFQRRYIIGPILVLIGLTLLYYSYYLL